MVDWIFSLGREFTDTFATTFGREALHLWVVWQKVSCTTCFHYNWKDNCFFPKQLVRNSVCACQLYCIRGCPAPQSGPHRREAASVRHMWSRLASVLSINHFLQAVLNHILLSELFKILSFRVTCFTWPVLFILTQDLTTWVISKSTRGLMPQTRRSHVTNVGNPLTRTENF